MGEPKKVDSKSSVYETIVYMFENDIGSVFITEQKDILVGVVSRKDLLKAALGNKDLEKLPIHMVMTRMPNLDRKSTRLNSSHANISYAVFCLKKKNKQVLTISNS